MKNILKGFAIFIILFFGFSLFLLSTHFGGWRAFIVMSGSMEPIIKTGSLVITQQIRPTILKTDDIITFISPTKKRKFITHRIAAVKHNGSVTIFKTKGDKNKSQDNWQLAGGGVVGKVVWTIPYVGYFFTFSKTRIGIALLILVPSLLILVSELQTLSLLIQTWKQKIPPASQTQAFIIFFLSVLFTTASFQPTQALLSDSANLLNNQFTIISSNDCSDNTVIKVSNNGASSSTTVNVANSSTVSVSSTNHDLSSSQPIPRGGEKNEKF